MNNTGKWLVGIGSLVILFFLGKRALSKNSNLKLEQDKVEDAGGNASESDAIGQKYSLLKDYKAMNTGTMKDTDYKEGTVFEKKNDKNGTNINMQSAVKVYSADGEFVIPVVLLKKSSGQIVSKKIKVEMFFKSLKKNPPKSKEEAEKRLAESGLTQADIDAYNKEFNQAK